MASWGYIALGFGATAIVIGGYAARLERRIARLRESSDGPEGPR